MDCWLKEGERSGITTDSKHDYPIACNILDRDYTVHGRNKVSDMTCLRTGVGMDVPNGAHGPVLSRGRWARPWGLPIS